MSISAPVSVLRGRRQSSWSSIARVQSNVNRLFLRNDIEREDLYIYRSRIFTSSSFLLLSVASRSGCGKLLIFFFKIARFFETVDVESLEWGGRKIEDAVRCCDPG